MDLHKVATRKAQSSRALDNMPGVFSGLSLETHLLTEHGGQNGHAQTLCHGLAQDGEAAMGNGASNKATHCNQDEDDAHPLQVLPHLLFLFEETFHGSYQSNGARGIAEPSIKAPRIAGWNMATPDGCNWRGEPLAPCSSSGSAFHALPLPSSHAQYEHFETRHFARSTVEPTWRWCGRVEACCHPQPFLLLPFRMIPVQPPMA